MLTCCPLLSFPQPCSNTSDDWRGEPAEIFCASVLVRALGPEPFLSHPRWAFQSADYRLKLWLHSKLALKKRDPCWKSFILNVKVHLKNKDGLISVLYPKMCGQPCTVPLQLSLCHLSPRKEEWAERGVCCLWTAECLQTSTEKRKKTRASLQASRGSCCLISRRPLPQMPKSPILHQDRMHLIQGCRSEAWEKTGWCFKRTYTSGPQPRHFCKHSIICTEFTGYKIKLLINWKRNFLFKLL